MRSGDMRHLPREQDRMAFLEKPYICVLCTNSTKIDENYFVLYARRDEEISSPSYSSEEQRRRHSKIISPRTELRNRSDFFVAPPQRSKTTVSLSRRELAAISKLQYFAIFMQRTLAHGFRTVNRHWWVRREA